MTNPNEPTRIIAIGASAGGIEALYSFFDRTPLDQVSYVVILHLSSDHQSRLAELLKKHSKLQICVAENNMTVATNHVYVIPNKSYLTIQAGKFQLTHKSNYDRPHMTIDTFFKSLAADQGTKTIGIILSGTGMDGSAGIQAIRQAGGWVMVQDPLTAQYDQMPKSAIATGYASTVHATEAMPGAIQAYVKQHPFAEPVPPSSENNSPAHREQNLTSGPAFQGREEDTKELMTEAEESTLVAILDLIKEELPLDFSDYKRSTVFRRIRRRMALQQLSQADAYLNYLKENPPELQALAKDFLISVTAFFRDSRAFEILERKIIPTIMRTGSDPVKIWVAGCATGEEAYSIAMLVHEYLDQSPGQRDVKIFATDLDQAALSVAFKGVYPVSSIKQVAPARLERFFTREAENFKVKNNIRQMLIFAHHDLTKNPPYCHIDLISCRNLLIYLNPTLQKKVFSLLHFGLQPSGYLFLGSSEQAPVQELKFLEIDKKARIYQKVATSIPIQFEAFSLPPAGGTLEPYGQLISSARHNPAPIPAKPLSALPPGNHLSEPVITALLEYYQQVGVCLDENRCVVQAFGDLSPFLIAKGFNFNFNLMELLPESLLVAFGTAFNQAMLIQEPVAIGGIRNELDPTSTIHLLIKPFVASRTGQKLMLLLLSLDVLPSTNGQEMQPFDPDSHTRAYITFLEAELRDSKENLLVASEKLES